MSQSNNDFATILAASVHDLKNTLYRARTLINQLANDPAHSKKPEFKSLEYEANRMNNSLIQLLLLYKINSTEFQPLIEEYPVLAMIKDIVAQQAPLQALSHIALSYECADDLIYYGDNNLINIVLASVVNNAQRYCRQQILITAKAVEAYICFTVEDDGEGYPPAMLLQTEKSANPINLDTSSTGLGTLFAATIARLHCNGAKCGYITIDNDSRYGGGRFRLFLP